jgi:hypothetical protein
MRRPRPTLDITIAAAWAGARVITLSDATLRRWARTPGVPLWESLYQWLVEEGYSDRRDLHARTCVGDVLMARLRDAERARLHQQGLRGRQLRSAVAWSDAGSGPTTWWSPPGDTHVAPTLAGDGLFVTAPDEAHVPSGTNVIDLQAWRRDRNRGGAA